MQSKRLFFLINWLMFMFLVSFQILKKALRVMKNASEVERNTFINTVRFKKKPAGTEHGSFMKIITKIIECDRSKPSTKTERKFCKDYVMTEGFEKSFLHRYE